ncbi:MAG TPA: hypothetical protein PLO53_03550 [Candidatus Hydrogenedentes bacterium]|mgnify:CR=1 FL=1|nr:hypothetical protein [Candidatus Hydrogenedentota bacterium]HPU97013.1 hypothetical protein [Candidatus Hydrogenedentota bacterium]
MITITLTTALWLYGMAILVLAVLLWGYTEWTGGRIRRALEKQSCWRCAYCGYVYLDEGMATYSTCPRCESINVPAEGQDPLVSRKKALAAEASKTDAESLSDGEKQESRRNPARKKRPHATRRGPRKRRGGS